GRVVHDAIQRDELVYPDGSHDDLLDLIRLGAVQAFCQRYRTPTRPLQLLFMPGLSTRPLLAAGLIGPPLFIVVFLIEGATRPGYSAWRNYVSQLATGEGGWVQVVNFIVCGTLMVAFAVGLRLALRRGRASVAAPVLLGAFGMALLVAGVFVTDPALGYPPGTGIVHTT